jgi:SAM-dependent methyltransferase
METNTFGLKKHSMLDIFKDQFLIDILQQACFKYFCVQGFDNEDAQYLSTFTLNTCRDNSDLDQILLKLGGEFKKWDFNKNFFKLSNERVDYLFSNIGKYVLDPSRNLADIGTGLGFVAKRIAEHNVPLVTTDIKDFRNDIAKDLDFYHCTQNEPLPFPDKSYDTSLLIAVLHHSEDPLNLFKEVDRITKDRLVIIESIYDLTNDDLPKNRLPECKEYYDAFEKLNPEQRYMYGTFFDWVLNAPFKPGVSVPYNFNTRKGWKNLFKEYDFNVVEERVLAFDQPDSPEPHVLYVLKRNK